MTRSKLLYIFPSNWRHSGINVKVNGQISTLKENYAVHLVYIPFKKSNMLLKNLFPLLLFEFTTFIKSIFFDLIYIRYNPKTPFTLWWCGCLSFFKPVYIEHNTLLKNELSYLKRPIELATHKACMAWLSRTKCTHIAVNNQLKHHLIQEFNTKESLTVYCQNGYLLPDINEQQVNQDLLNRILTFHQSEKKLAIFTGNGYPWHGLKEVIQIIKTHPTIQLIIAGPYNLESTEQTLVLGTVNMDTLLSIYPMCDFAISTFRWDLLGITEGSPLKTREYLCNGLPILTHYYDCAEDFESLKPYVFNLQRTPTAIKEILSLKTSKKDICKISQFCLSWRNIWQQSNSEGIPFS